MRVFLLLVLFLCEVALAAEPPGLMRLTPRPAPPLVLTDMDGRVTDLASLRGRWVMVHFWASWCGPCRREMPTLVSVMRTLPRQQLTVLLVNTAEGDDEGFAFLASVAPELDTLMDRDGQTTARWAPRGLPSTFLVDPEGRLRYIALGGRDWSAPLYLDLVRALTEARGP